jgi:hypothetical protein
MNPGDMLNCCTPMDLDGDGRINDILFSCYISSAYVTTDYMYGEILRRNETWCKKTWNKAFDDDGYITREFPDYKPLDAC